MSTLWSGDLKEKIKKAILPKFSKETLEKLNEEEDEIY